MVLGNLPPPSLHSIPSALSKYNGTLHLTQQLLQKRIYYQMEDLYNTGMSSVLQFKMPKNQQKLYINVDGLYKCLRVPGKLHHMVMCLLCQPCSYKKKKILKKIESGKKLKYWSHMPPSEFASFLVDFGFSVLFLA